MKNIINEEPDIHWGFLDVKDKVVLDLGCGKFYSSISTAEYFLNSGAESVIGVDLSDIGITDDRFTMIIEHIHSTEQLEDLNYRIYPDVIKCDIEGAEMYFDGIPGLPGETTQFAVEYHDNKTKLICEKKLKEWGFEIEYYQLLGEDINRIGVIHGWKNF